jgi:excisionase family DNA binding protein
MTAQLEFHFPAIVTPRGDGTWLVKPGRPVPRPALVSTSSAARILGVHRKTVLRYVDEGLLTATQAKPRARVRLHRLEVEALAEKRRD